MSISRTVKLMTRQLRQPRQRRQPRQPGQPGQQVIMSRQSRPLGVSWWSIEPGNSDKSIVAFVGIYKIDRTPIDKNLIFTADCSRRNGQLHLCVGKD